MVSDVDLIIYFIFFKKSSLMMMMMMCWFFSLYYILLLLLHYYYYYYYFNLFYLLLFSSSSYPPPFYFTSYSYLHSSFFCFTLSQCIHDTTTQRKTTNSRGVVGSYSGYIHLALVECSSIVYIYSWELRIIYLFMPTW